MRTRLLVLPVLLALGACSSDPRPSYVARVELPETLPVSGPDASLMLVQMPAPGGLVTDVRETTYPNGVMQQAVLEGGNGGFGENRLEVSVMTGPPAGPGSLALAPPSQDSVRREIIARYPKVEMRIVTQPRQNALGVFGLAIGRAPSGVRCIFAWQWVDDIRGRSGGGSLFGGRSSAGTPASIRIHLCRKDATVDDLAATVEGMTLAPPAIVERALDPRRMAATIPAREIRDTRVSVAASTPPEGSLESALAPQRHAVAVASAEPKPQRKATRVARRAPAQAEGEAVVARTPPAAQQPAYGGGPRYLAPVASSPAAPVMYGNPAPVASAATSGLDPSLPAAAYRGPNYRGN